MQWMRSKGWQPVFLGMALALGWTGYAAAAGASQQATQTALTVETSNAGPRTKVTLTAHVVSVNGSEGVGGVVNFRASGAQGLNSDLGSAAVDGEGNAALTTDNLAAGNLQVVAAYSGDAAHGASLSASQQVQAEASTGGVAGFTVSATPTSFTTPAGGFITSVITVTPENGFNSQLNTYVSLSCSELPFGAACTFSPTSLLVSCNPTCTAGVSTLQFQTLGTKPTSMNQLGNRPGSPPGNGQGLGTKLPVYAFLFPAMCGLAGLGARKRQIWRKAGLVLLVFAGALSMTACNPRYNYLNHGPIPNTGTPAGAYTITINSVAALGSSIITPPTSPQLAITVTPGTQSATSAVAQ
jgi:Bacterial Ig-like domain (group 3)